jgi:thiol-disulfide isomerase/thioredoxin
MKRWIPTLVLLLIAFGVYQWKTGAFGRRDPGKLSGDTCGGKEFCVSVYMAPWCPHCKTALPQVQKMLALTQTGGKTGVRVVIGMGEPDKNEAMAKSIAKEGVVIDHDTSIAKKLNIRGVPSFIVLDKEGTVIVDGPEAHEWIAEKFGG